MRASTPSDQHADENAERRQRTLVGNPGDARHHQRERDGEPALLQRHGERQRQRCDRTGREDRGGGGACRAVARAGSAFRSRARTARPAAAQPGEGSDCSNSEMR